MKRLLPWLLLAMLIGCAAQVEYIEEETIAEKPQWTEAQADSIIRFNRMFFFDYYNQMSRKNEFNQDGCIKALSYFWNYIPLDRNNKYNDFPQAARCYSEIAQSNPEYSDSARVVYEMGLERFPESDYLHNALGIIYKSRGNLEKAEYHFTRASQIDPSRKEYLEPLTEIYQQKGEWVKAKETCEKVLEIDPSNTVIRDRLESILRDHFSPEEFIASLLKKLELEPENVDIWLQLSQQYFNLGKNSEALKSIQETLKLKPVNVEALVLLGAIKENLADYNGAIDAYKKILEVKPQRVDILLDVANAYKNLEQYSTARIYCLKALDIEPGSGSALVKLGELYEAAADVKSRGKQATYSDKLVFTIAYGLFQRAANSTDYTAKENAQRKINYLQSNLILPQKADWFMHKSEYVPKKSEYEWINEDWEEVKFIKTYLKQYE